MFQIRLAALEHFKCLGGECPDTCCQSWQIDIDDVTFERWQQLPAGELRAALLSEIDTRTGDSHSQRTIRLGANGYCPHFTADGLCRIQAEAGHELLPDICRSYPRLRSANERLDVASAQLSCPEVARLVLFADADKPVFGGSGFMPAASGGPEAIPAFLDALAHAILGQTKYPLSARITHLALQLAGVASRSTRGELSAAKLPVLVREARRSLYETNLSIKTGRLRPDPALAGSFWIEVVRFNEQLFRREAAHHPRIEQLLQLYDTPTAERASAIPGIHARVQEARESARPKCAPHALAFERHFIATLRNQGYPWLPLSRPEAENQVALFLNALFVFATAQLLLWLRAMDSGTLGQDEVVSAVYRAERALTHSNRVYETLGRNPVMLRLDLYYPCLVELG